MNRNDLMTKKVSREHKTDTKQAPPSIPKILRRRGLCRDNDRPIQRVLRLDGWPFVAENGGFCRSCGVLCRDYARPIQRVLRLDGGGLWRTLT